MNTRKIFVADNGNNGYANWCQGTIVHTMEEADLVVFVGGADIDPRIYGENTHATTYSNYAHDLREIAEFKKAVSLNKPMMGTCRGAQLIGAMVGAKLVQDQDHSHYHEMETFDGKKLVVNSIHHQSVFPWHLPESKCKVLGWTKGLSPYHKGGNDQEMVNDIVPDNKEVELFVCKEVRALAPQFHLEMLYYQQHPRIVETIKYHQNLLNMLLDGSINNL